MHYNGKEMNLEEFIEHKHKSWIDRGDTEASWHDEGIVWAVEEYYGSMGKFSEEDWETIERLHLEEVAAYCEEENED